MIERRIYRVILGMNFGQDLRTEGEIDKIVEAAEHFTNSNKGRKRLIVLDSEKNRMDLLIQVRVNSNHKNFTLRLITQFLKDICVIYNAEYKGSKGYFTIEQAKLLSEDECSNLIANNSIYMKLRSSSNISSMDALVDIKNKQDKGEESDKDNSTLDKKFDWLDGKIPRREFPTLFTGSHRLKGIDRREGVEYSSLKSTLQYLGGLVGMEEVKREIDKITTFIIKSNHRCISLNINNPGLYYNTVISGNKGTGKSTVAKILYHIYYHLGVIGEGKFIICDSREMCPSMSIDRSVGNAQSGVILIDNAHLISIPYKRSPKDNIGTLDHLFSYYKNNFVFILAGEADGMETLLELEEIKKHMDFFLDMPDFNSQQTFILMQQYASQQKYSVEADCEGIVEEYVSYLKKKGTFENVYTAVRLMEKAIKNSVFNDHYKIKKADLPLENSYSREKQRSETIVSEIDPFKELEDMIGLCEVKEKVREISAYAAAQLQRRKLGLSSGSLCLHMSFVGNPGTGKTSIARFMGRILNKLGVLSTGKFVEVTREDLVGKYVGHTAAQTAEKIKEAEGGVLFIDEAYSLDSDSKIDYGYEAVSTLVKKMEDLRDNLVIIFAGYPKEMKGFISMNPGLKDRVQFEIQFKDYTPKELHKIWKKFFYDNQYQVEKAALREMALVVRKLHEGKENSFANGRVIRKCFERVKMYQAVRIMDEEVTETQDVVKITAADIKKLYEDRDIAEMLETATLKRTIGFHR